MLRRIKKTNIFYESTCVFDTSEVPLSHVWGNLNTPEMRCECTSVRHSISQSKKVIANFLFANYSANMLSVSYVVLELCRSAFHGSKCCSFAAFLKKIGKITILKVFYFLKYIMKSCKKHYFAKSDKNEFTSPSAILESQSARYQVKFACMNKLCYEMSQILFFGERGRVECTAKIRIQAFHARPTMFLF